MAGVATNAAALVALLSILVTSVRSDYYSPSAAAPSSSYSPAPAPSSTYSTPAAPSSTYSTPAAPSSNYGTPAAPSSNYGTPAAPSSNSGWLPAKATWYGKPNGAGPDNNGGACNFGKNNLAPFYSMTSCGNQALFKDGAGCGACYQIRCNKKTNQMCSNEAKTVVITDINDGPMAKYHFDLSGTAFGAMALPGKNDQLRRAGIIDIQFKRVPCNWPGVKLTFYIVKGANPYYLPVMVLNVNKDGTVVKLEVQRSSKGSWEPMYRSWGAVWRRDSGNPLVGPLSFRVTSESGKPLVATNVIPAGWKGGNSYTSSVQFY